MKTMTAKLLLIFAFVTVTLVNSSSGHGGHDEPKPKESLLNSFTDKILSEGANGVFDWVFGDPK